MTIVCELFQLENQKAALDFLKDRYAKSMFLLSNMEDQGVVLSEHPNSGNFKILRDGDNIVGVFCLARRGNLILTCEPISALFDIILHECAKEPIKIQGVIGEWAVSSAVWSLLQAQKKINTCSMKSKEILYQLPKILVSENVPEVRLLTEYDFDEWLPLRRAYNIDIGFTRELQVESLRTTFSQYARMQEFWGYFENGRMVATAALNAVVLDIGQVGGVYTVPELRRQGYSNKIMRQLLNDSVSLHGLDKMILFTGENNISAQKVYEKLGFQKIGFFGIYFS